MHKKDYLYRCLDFYSKYYLGSFVFYKEALKPGL